MKKLLFVTQNKYKFEEYRDIFFNQEPFKDYFKGKIDFQMVEYKIDEIQSENIDKLIEDKTLKAFQKYKQPVLVDHSGLCLGALNGLPGGLTQLFWDRLLSEKICRLCIALEDKKAEALVYLGFCDTKKIYTFSASIGGYISDKPRGGRKFQWDEIFIPEGTENTYGEMDIEDKNKISQRRAVIEKFYQTLLRETDFLEL
jgi:XTP/dITP diphosphohydrolase